MKNEGREVIVLDCKRCGWKWSPRKKRVILCPKCKSAYWNIEKKGNFLQQLNLDANI